MNRVCLPPESLHGGDLILVSGRHPYWEKRSPELTALPGTGSPVLLDRRAAEPLCQLMETIGGWAGIVPVSGWRSRREQQTIWEKSLAEHGPAFTETYVAKPGCSEHETGLAIDLGKRSGEVDFLCPDFPREGLCQTFRDLAPQYGFIQRYPAGKEGVTGIGHEPWHFRWVGRPHAALMTKLGLTLEEYLDFLRDYPHGRRAYETRTSVKTWISYLPAGAENSTWLDLPEGFVYRVSGTNTDGFIITRQRSEDVRQAYLRRP